jgi:biopolymer transport protein TolR
MQVGEEGNVKSEPNVVPMIDIMLVLLIIFMIVTPVISKGFVAEMPLGKNLEARAEKEGDIVLGIDKNGRYYLDPGTGTNGIVPNDQLGAVLKQLYDNRTQDKIMYFRADKDLDFGKIQDAIEVARTAGVRVLDAITEDLQEKKGAHAGAGSGGR